MSTICEQHALAFRIQPPVILGHARRPLSKDVQHVAEFSKDPVIFTVFNSTGDLSTVLLLTIKC